MCGNKHTWRWFRDHQYRIEDRANLYYALHQAFKTNKLEQNTKDRYEVLKNCQKQRNIKKMR